MHLTQLGSGALDADEPPRAAAARLSGYGRHVSVPGRRVRAGLAAGGARLARLRPQRLVAGTATGFRIIWPISMRCSMQLSAGVPVRLVGHSMGGNIASLYAGLRPRARALRWSISRDSACRAPRRTRRPTSSRKWLDQVKSVPPLKDYESFEQLASIIRHRYPRFSEAQSASSPMPGRRLEADGRVHLLGDARHRWVNPRLYKREDAEACWRAHHGAHADAGRRAVRLSCRASAPTAREAAFRSIIPDVEIAHIARRGTHAAHREAGDRCRHRAVLERTS